MRFAARVYLVAGIIGLVEIVPMYFTESMVGIMYPPQVTHPEFYYGFAGVTVAWQILFLTLARDPLRFRPLMLPAILEKASFVAAALVLYAGQRMTAAMLGPVGIDAILGVLFVIAYERTRTGATAEDAPVRND